MICPAQTLNCLIVRGDFLLIFFSSLKKRVENLVFGDDDSDDYSSLFEIGVKLYSQYRNLEGFPAEKKFVS